MIALNRKQVYEQPRIIECYYDEDDVICTSGEKDEYETPEF